MDFIYYGTNTTHHCIIGRSYNSLLQIDGSLTTTSQQTDIDVSLKPKPSSKKKPQKSSESSSGSSGSSQEEGPSREMIAGMFPERKGRVRKERMGAKAEEAPLHKERARKGRKAAATKAEKDDHHQEEDEGGEEGGCTSCS